MTNPPSFFSAPSMKTRHSSVRIHSSVPKPQETEWGSSLSLNNNSENHHHHEFNQIIKKRKMSEIEDGFHDLSGLSKQEFERKRIENRIRSFRYLPPEEERGDRLLKVSTELKLFEDPWKIKKRLTQTDVNHQQSRFLFPSNAAQLHIIALWEKDWVEKVEIKLQSAKVTVWDYDTATAHKLGFKIWPSSQSYVFTENWISEFLKRRRLKARDEIGLFWDSTSSRFGFRVLVRAHPSVEDLCSVKKSGTTANSMKLMRIMRLLPKVGVFEEKEREDGDSNRIIWVTPKVKTFFKFK